MKKLNSVKIIKMSIIITLCFFMFISFVKADAPVPSVSPYNVIVPINKKINLYSYDEKIVTTIPSDTILVVRDEKKLSASDILYGEVGYDNYFGYINLNEVKLVKESFDYKELKKDKEYKTCLIEAVSLYKGPAKVYGLVDNKETVPANTIISSYYYDNHWMYIEYENTTGWVLYYANRHDFGLPYKDNIKITTIADTYMYKDVKNNKTNVVIPKNTELESNFYGSNDTRAFCNNYYFIEYEGTIGYVYDNDVSLTINHDGILFNSENENISVYDNPDGSVIKTLKGLEQVKIMKENVNTSNLIFAHWYYIESPSINGWVKSSDLLFKNEITINDLKGYFEIYESIYDLHKKIKNIKILDNEKINITYFLEYKGNKWYYINNYNGTSGWINYNTKNYSNIIYPYPVTELDIFQENKLDSKKIKLINDKNLIHVIETKDFDKNNLKFKWYYVSILDSNEYGYVLPLIPRYFNKTMYIYAEKDINSQKLDFVSETDKVMCIDIENEKDDNWYYIYNYNGISGWINPDLKFISEIEKERNEKLTSSIYAVIISFVTVLTSIVIIILINKTKKSKTVTNLDTSNNTENHLEDNEKEL